MASKAARALMRLRPMGLGGSSSARIGAIRAHNSLGTCPIVGNASRFVLCLRISRTTKSLHTFWHRSASPSPEWVEAPFPSPSLPLIPVLSTSSPRAGVPCHGAVIAPRAPTVSLTLGERPHMGTSPAAPSGRLARSLICSPRRVVLHLDEPRYRAPAELSCPGAGSTPSCCSILRSSRTARCSTPLPSTIRTIWICCCVKCLPVGGMPINVP